MNLIKSELRKLTYTKSFWLMTLAAIALAVLSTAPTPYILSDLGGEMSFGNLSDQATVDTVYANALSAYIFAIILGILIMAGEFRHGTAVATFLAAPKRASVLVAKIIVAVFAGIFVMVVSTIFGFIGGAVALGFYPDAAAPSVEVFVNTSIAAILSGAVLAALGVALGTLIKNQLVAVVSALIWLFVVEPILLLFLVDAAKFFPTGLITAMLSLDVDVNDPTNGVGINTADYLDPIPAALLLVAYGVVFSVVALATSLRRDID